MKLINSTLAPSIVLLLSGGLNSPKFQINRGGRSNVQFTSHTLRQKKTVTFVAVFFCFFLRRWRDLPTPAPQRAKRAAAQITEQSRVDKLACQRGGEGCYVAARRRTSAGRSPKGAPRTCATRSRVQIYGSHFRGCLFFVFYSIAVREFFLQI